MLPTIALFGGAFDPPHLGHTAIIINLLKRSEFDKIVIIPTGPRKDKNYHIPDILRKEMIQLWKETLSTSETEASRVVLDFDVFDGKVGEGTYEHEAYFQKKYTAREIFHVFGSDTISTMNEWEPHGDIVAQELLKIIFNRK